ncbi:hypothetical protein PIB30_079601 [Stylosanthes scabra]|uniref:Uncharacterized protein n=1 Tax=Stylosanthes scabra TaxID=79078 RepID=A0ABU6ZQ02_9FABA|nr:hypothetical protein [Stylosanthes scabra]
MNKTPEEAWELIVSMADNNQHFKVRATSAAKYVFEVTPSELTILAKSLVDIAAMLKEIKEGQVDVDFKILNSVSVYHVTPKLLTHQANTSQQFPVKQCGICSCNSHHTDECPQLQEDHIIAASHNFYENQQLPPSNKQYYTQPQGWRDNQQNRWNSSQQPQQIQFCQPYTYSRPQNPQNHRYQPPHIRQTYPPPNVPPPNYEETLRVYQQESKEMKETQKRFESQLSHITDLLHKFTNQPTTIPQPQPSTQVLYHPNFFQTHKGGINMVHNENDEEEEEEDEDDWLYELLAELAESDDSDDEEVEKEPEKKVDDEVVEEETNGEILFIATIFRGNKVEESEIPIKCEDPGPCLITCKIREIDIPECLCDPGASCLTHFMKLWILVR